LGLRRRPRPARGPQHRCRALGGRRGRDRSGAAAAGVVHRRQAVHPPPPGRGAGAGGPAARQRARVRAEGRPMSAGRRVAMLSLAALLAGGCAAGTAGLDVRYPQAGVNRAMLGTVAPRAVEIVPVVDRRVDPTRIGTSPKTGQDIVTARPVTEVVREALALELAKNGHALVAGRRDVALAASVEEFWLDTVVGHSTTQYVGKIAVALAVTDGRTGDAVLARRYIGIKRR